jgi:hypothetical protein
MSNSAAASSEQKVATAAKRSRAPNKTTATPPKSQVVLQLLQRPEGAMLAELQIATEWQPHSIRGFISGIARKRLGLNVRLITSEDSQQRYRVVEQ